MVRNQANDRRFANSVPEGGGGRDRKNSDRWVSGGFQS